MPADAPQLPIEAQPPTIAATLAANVAYHPENALVVGLDERMTFREAEERSRRLAKALMASGIGKGSRVGLLFPNGAEFMTAFLATTRIGAVACLFNTFMKPPEIAQQLRHSDAQILLAAPRFLKNDYVTSIGEALPELASASSTRVFAPSAPFLREIAIDAPSTPPWASSFADLLARGDDVDDAVIRAAEEAVVPADLLGILYTSGSTAAPKGVVHAHGPFIRRQRTIAASFGYQPGDRHYGPMPWFWLGGLSFLMCGFVSGATVLFEERFDSSETLALLERERVTHATGWPHYAASLRADPSFSERDLSAMRGGNLYDGLFGAPRDPSHFAGGIGMTETAGQHSFQTAEKLPERLYGATGRLSDDVEHRIVDPETGRVLPDGEIGELQVRGFSVMQGYYKREREDVFERDGFFRTGDLGKIEEGFYFFTGRLGNMIKTSGANVSPPEVEAEIRELPGVAMCIVTGIPDAERDEVVAAAIVPAPDASLSVEGILAELKPKLSAFKLPKVIRFLAADEIPALPTGKLDQRGLKRLLAEG